MRPIRVYVLILVLGAMLPGLVLTGILVLRSFATNRAISERRLLESARVDASALDREFNSTIGILQTLAASPALDRDDLAQFTRLDLEGTIAVRTRGSEDYVGGKAPEPFRTRIHQEPENVASLRTRDGMPVYAAFSRGAYGWTTVVVVQRAVLDGAMWGSMAALLTGGISLILPGLTVVLFISRRLATDLASATAAAEAVADGRSLPQGPAHVAETSQLQRSLATAASLLERRARERDAEMTRADSARREAEEANQTKDQFLAVLGHELRNPLAPALTALELMKARDPEVFRREREVLERQVAHMARLVNDLLDVSRLARGKVQLDRRRFELREAVDRAVDMTRPTIAQHRHTLAVSVPSAGLMIDGDVDRIVQVLSNLLTNAAKYTPPGGHIALAAQASDDKVVIACENDGPGIPPDQLQSCSIHSPRAHGPSIDVKEGWAWVSRWREHSPSCMTARSVSNRADRTAAVASSSRCRCNVSCR